MNKIKSLLKRKCYGFLEKLYPPILDRIDRSFDKGEGGLEMLLRKEFLKEKYVCSKHQSIDKITSEYRNFIRIGDGELPIFHKKNSGFHQYSENLSKRMLEAYYFALSCENFVVGVNPDLIYSFTRVDDPSLISSCKNYKLLDFLSFFPLKEYVDALVLRSSPLSFYQEKKRLENYSEIRQASLHSGFYQNTQIGIEIFDYYKQNLIEPIKQLWKDKNVIVCEGSFSSFGKYNDLFDEAKSITRVHAKNYNAFSDYNNLFENTLRCVAQFPQDDVYIVCALGHTSKILLVDLYRQGYRRGIDAGNFSIAYDSYLYDFPQEFIDDPIQMFCYPPIHYGVQLKQRN